MYYRNNKYICFIWSKTNLMKINLYLATKFYGSFMYTKFRKITDNKTILTYSKNNMSFTKKELTISDIAGDIMTSIETENTSNKIPTKVSLSVTLPVTLSASESLFARTECMKTVVLAARRREGVVVAPVGVNNNMTVCYVSVN